jgi:hypothetical protein
VSPAVHLKWDRWRVPRRLRGRSWLVWSLVVLSTVLLLVASMTVWTKRQLLNTDAWTDSASQLLADDQIRGLLSSRIADLLNQRVDVQAQLEERLPPRAQSAAPAVAAALESATARVVDTFLSTARAQTLWENINRRAHKAIVNVLEGKDAGPISTANGNVVLDLRPMIAQIATRLGIEDRLKQGADPKTGEIVILRSDQLDAAQTAVKVFRFLTVFLVIAVLVLYAVAVYLAHPRRRIVLAGVGTSLLLCGLILAIVRRIAGNLIVDSLVKVEANKPAVLTAWVVETNLLRDIAIALIAYGILTILGAFLAGPSRPATAIRRAAAPTLKEHPALVYAGAAVLFLIVIAWGPTAATRQLVGALILAALFFGGLEVWRRQAIREAAASEAAPGDAQKPALRGA